MNHCNLCGSALLERMVRITYAGKPVAYVCMRCRYNLATERITSEHDMTWSEYLDRAESDRPVVRRRWYWESSQ